MPAENATLRVNVWSGPRNLSTALMYSWRSRSDTTVVDEPLYAHYLTVMADELAATDRQHPGTQDVLAAQNADGSEVVAHMLGPWGTPVVMFKQMSKHLAGLPPPATHRLMVSCRNVILTRNPKDMLLSFQQQVPNASLADTGLEELVGIAEQLEAQGQEPVVVDSHLLLQNPESVLGQLCDRLGIAFQSAMLAWPPGPKPEDGVWAPHWYESVHQSTGFAQPVPRDGELSARLAQVLDEANALYDRLRRWQIQPAGDSSIGERP